MFRSTKFRKAIYLASTPAVAVPNSPTNGQTMVVGARTWTYNSSTTTWEVVVGGTSGTDYSGEFLLDGM